MDGYTDTEVIVVRQVQAERLARPPAIGSRPRSLLALHRGPADVRVLDAARLLVTVVLMTIGIAGLAGTLLGGPTAATSPGQPHAQTAVGA
jgi:hypothetical protein